MMLSRTTFPSAARVVALAAIAAVAADAIQSRPSLEKFSSAARVWHSICSVGKNDVSVMHPAAQNSPGWDEICCRVQKRAALVAYSSTVHLNFHSS